MVSKVKLVEGIFDFMKRRQPDVAATPSRRQRDMDVVPAKDALSKSINRRDRRQTLTIYGLPLAPVEIKRALDTAFRAYEVLTDLSKRQVRTDPVQVSYFGRARIAALPKQLMIESYDYDNKILVLVENVDGADTRA